MASARSTGAGAARRSASSRWCFVLLSCPSVRSPGERLSSRSSRFDARAAAAPARSVPVRLATPIALPSASAKAAVVPRIRCRRRRRTMCVRLRRSSRITRSVWLCAFALLITISLLEFGTRAGGYGLNAGHHQALIRPRVQRRYPGRTILGQRRQDGCPVRPFGRPRRPVEARAYLAVPGIGNEALQ